MKDIIKSIILYAAFFILFLLIKWQLGFEDTVLAGIALCVVVILENKKYESTNSISNS